MKTDRFALKSSSTNIITLEQQVKHLMTYQLPVKVIAEKLCISCNAVYQASGYDSKIAKEN